MKFIGTKREEPYLFEVFSLDVINTAKPYCAYVFYARACVYSSQFVFLSMRQKLKYGHFIANRKNCFYTANWPT